MALIFQTLVRNTNNLSMGLKIGLFHERIEAKKIHICLDHNQDLAVYFEHLPGLYLEGTYNVDIHRQLLQPWDASKSMT